MSNSYFAPQRRAGNRFLAWKTSTDPPHSRRWRVRPLLYWMAALFVVAASTTAASQTETQHGSKLVGTGTQGPSEQGWSVALSADGNTAIVGGIVDNKLTGAAWVFTRSSDTWSQQGNKLVGTGVIGQAGQGVSVALSADGNTAMVGGPYDNSRAGAAWVFNRSGDAWSQQGSKLVGNGSDGKAAQGASVALSADGNTAIVGGAHDDSTAGAAWVFTRSGDAWTQQGKLVGTGAVGKAGQGSSVALSADGNTAIVGGPLDNSDAGAAWVFTRSGGVWKQLGSKLVGTGAAGEAWQGFSVALSADGNTAIVGGPARQLERRGGVGVYPQRGRVEPAGRQAGRHRRGWKRETRLLRRAVRRWQHRHRGRALRQLGRRSCVGLRPEWDRLEPAAQKAGWLWRNRTR